MGTGMAEMKGAPCEPVLCEGKETIREDAEVHARGMLDSKHPQES